MPNILSLTGKRCFPRFAEPSWSKWRVFLKTVFAIQMSADEFEVFRARTGRQQYFSAAVREGYAIAGRRAGKSQIAALIAIYLACFCKWPMLVEGETGIVLIVASEKPQAQVIFKYVKGLVNSVPALKDEVTRDTGTVVEFGNLGTAIEVRAASVAGLRGPTYIGVLGDEVAFWKDEDSSNPDSEVLEAVRPALSTTGGPLLLFSSPYARRGVLWQAFKENFGNDRSDILVWQAATLDQRDPAPDLLVKEIERAYEKDPASAAAEYGGQFRQDIESFIDDELLAKVVVSGRFELAPVAGVSYFGFVDPSGGSGDSFTLAIAHREKEQVILDCVREAVPPFSPETVVEQFAETLATYGVKKIAGDRYAGEWPREQFAKRGVVYEVSERTKSELYLSALPLFASGRAEVLDHKRMVAQFRGLDRRTSRSGKDSVDHSPGGKDDIANAAAGALVLAAGPPKKSFGIVETVPHRQYAQNRGLQEAVSSLRGRGGDDREAWQNFLRGSRRQMADLREI